MLTPSQIQTLAALIFAQLGANPTTQEISVWVGQEAAQKLPYKPLVWHTAEWIVHAVLEQTTPDGLIRAIRMADNQRSGFEALLELATRLETDPLEWAPTRQINNDDWTLKSDPLTVVDDGPFLDRLHFRQLLPRVGQPLTMPTCMLVRGDPGSGKSYLQDFCKSFAALRKDFVVAYTKLGSSGQTSPRLVSMELAIALDTNLDNEPLVHEDQHRDAKNLAGWITDFTPLRPVPSLIIVDDFGDKDLDKPVHTFVLELVSLIQSDERVAQRIRIVLLGYDPQRLEEKRLHYEDHILEHVDSTHIEEWLKLRFPSHTREIRALIVSSLEKRVPASGAMRLRMLNTYLRKICKELKPA